MNVDVIHIRPKKLEPLKVGDTLFKSAHDWELTEKDLEIAVRELGETEEKKKACLRQLKEKLAKKLNVKYRQDDFYLLRFLRVRKYDVKKAFHNVKLFFEVRKKHSDFFTLPQELKSAQEWYFSTVLPYTNEEGTIMIWASLDRWNPEVTTLEELMQSITTQCDIVSMNPHCQINGIMAVWDTSGLSWRHVSELLWNGRALGILSIFQNAYPWRIKKIIVINTNRLVRYIFSIVRPLIQRKIAERIILLGSDVAKLHQLVNPALLPERLQGTLTDEACDLSQYLLDNLPYLKYERTFIFQ